MLLSALGTLGKSLLSGRKKKKSKSGKEMSQQVLNRSNKEDEKLMHGYQENINNGAEWGWTTDYAFSVKNTPTDNPKTGDIGEWVLAEFTSEKFNTIEWYQFNEGKLINWYQFNSTVKS